MENSNLKEAINIVQDIVKSSNVSGGIINQFPFLRYLFPNLTGFSAFVERQKRINNFFMVSYKKFIFNFIKFCKISFLRNGKLNKNYFKHLHILVYYMFSSHFYTYKFFINI